MFQDQRNGRNSNQKPSFSKNNDKTPTIELKFIQAGFCDEKGNLREDLITEEAKSIAKVLVEDKLSNSQLRAFFNEIKAINNRLEDKKENWEKVYPSLLLIKSKIEYRASKDKNKMINFKEFLLQAIDYIKNKNKEGKGYETFKNFVIFFEAIVGYSYGFGIDK